jgi:uncharacterized protein with NRDE domain
MCILYVLVPKNGSDDASSSSNCSSSSNVPLIIANNRDEYLGRATVKGAYHNILEQSVGSHDADGGCVYYPTDAKAGGTWLAFDHGRACVSKPEDALIDAGSEPKIAFRGCGANYRFAVVLNFDEFRIGYNCDSSKSFKSRGLLCKNFINTVDVTAKEYAVELLAHLEEYRGFNFIVGDGVSGTYFVSNMDCPGGRLNPDAPADGQKCNFDTVSAELNTGNLVKLRPGELYAVSNGSFDDDSWPKIKVGKDAIRNILLSFSERRAVEPRTEMVLLDEAEPADSSLTTDNLGEEVVGVVVDGKRVNLQSIASNMLAVGISIAPPVPAASAICAHDSHPQFDISSENISSVASLILSQVLFNRTEYDDPLFESMSSDLARSLMSICIKPVEIHPEDEPGCYVRDVEYDSLNALRKALRAELLTSLPSDYVAPLADGTDAPVDESKRADAAELTVGIENDHMFGTRTSTVIVFNTCGGNKAGGVLLESDHVESPELSTLQRFNVVSA